MKNAMRILRRWSITSLALLPLVCFTPEEAKLQTKRSIEGYVRDADSGEALPYANVLIKGTYTGAATNVDGFFVILSVPAEVCTLQVTYLGYDPVDIEFDNSQQRSSPIEIKLKQSVLLSEEVIVTAEVALVEMSEKAGQLTLSPRQLVALPSMGEVDIFRSLQLLPGISAADDGSSGLYVRGGTPDQNLILFDGMKIYHVDHFFGFFSAFNSDAIKDVRVYKGGFPAEYGGRISSVVDLTGKTGDQNRTRFSIGANLLSMNAIGEFKPTGNSTMLISLRRSYTDFLKSGLYDKIYEFMTGDQDTNRGSGGFGGFRQGRGGGGGMFNVAESTPDFYFYDMNAKFTWSPTNRDIFAVSFYNGKDNLDQSTDFGGTRFNFGGDQDLSISSGDITKWGNIGISGKWSCHWNSRLYSHLLVSRSTYFSEYNRSSSVDGDIQNIGRFRAFGTDEDNDVNDLTVKFDNEFTLTNSHLLKIGTEYSQFSTSYNVTVNDTTNLLSRDTEAVMASAYLQNSWNVLPALNLTLGVRATNYDKTDETVIEPRASFNYKLTSNLNLKGAWGEYNQYVRRIANENVLQGSRDFWILADDELLPSKAEHRILGISWENETYLFDVEGYSKDLENLLEYSRRFNNPAAGGRMPGTGGITEVPNFYSGSGTSEGIEFLVQKKRGKLTGWVSYTRGEVEYIFPAINGGNPFPANHDRTHEFKVVSSYRLGLWNFSATWVFASGKAYTSPESQYYLTMLDGSQQSYIHVSDKNTNRLPDYHRLDVSVTRRIETEVADIDVGASAFNLYNHKNVYFREYTLDTTPVTVVDKLMLGFTPTLYVKLNF